MSAFSLFHPRFTNICIALLLAGALPNANAGALKLTESLSLTPTPCIKHALTTPNGKFTYATAFCEDSLLVFGRDITSGTLTQVDAVVGDENTGVGLRFPTSLALSPNGNFVFVYGTTGKIADAGNPYRNAIFVYQIDAVTGQLTFKFEYEATADRDLKTSPDGNYLYVLGQQKIEVLRVASNGQLSYAQDLAPSGAGESFSFSPDASRVYVSFYNANKIAIYDRDATTGQLLNARAASIPGVYKEAPAISPDGKYLYSFVNDALAQFAIAADGSLTSVANIASPPAQVASQFFCPTNMVISPNGRLLYFIDSCANNMQTWLRDTSTGVLSFAGFNHRDDLDIPDNAFSQTEILAFTPDNYFSASAYIYGITTMELTADIALAGDAPVEVAAGASFNATIDVGNLGGAAGHQLAVTLSGSALAGVTHISVSHPFGECHAVDATYVCTLPELVKAASETITLALIAPADADFTGALTLSANIDQAEIDKNQANDTLTFSIAKLLVASSSSTSLAASSVAVSSNSVATASSTPASSSAASRSNSSGGGGSTGALLLLGLVGLLAARRATV